MTTRRITIGMKPEPTATEPDEPAFSAAERASVEEGRPTAMIEDYASHRAHRPEQVSAEECVQQGGEAAKPPAAASLGGMSPLVGMGAAAVIGAIVAAVAVIVLSPKLAPSMDVRLMPVADRVAAIEIRQQQAEVALGRLNNEIAQAIEADDAAAASIEKQAAEFAEIQRLLASEVTAAPVAEKDMGLTIFAVAVGQLRAAFYSGRPFEAEVVTLRTLAAEDENLLGLLNELAAPARPGVANAAMLRQQFANNAAEAGIKIDGSQSYYDYGMSMVGEYIGYNNEPYSVEIAKVMVNDADRKLAGGDVSGAIEVIDGLDTATAAAFESWLKSAGAYVRAEASVNAMTETVVQRLREHMGAEDAG